jgi:hypothetical protein
MMPFTTAKHGTSASFASMMLRHASAYVMASDHDRSPLPERFEET